MDGAQTLSAGTSAAATSTCLRTKTRWREDGDGQHLAEDAATNLRGALVSLLALCHKGLLLRNECFLVKR